MSAAVLRCAGVAKSFGAGEHRVTVLHDLSFEVHRGEMVAIAGPSGAGKTTLLHLAALLDVPDRGDIEIEGRPTRHCAERERAALRAGRIGIIFQRFHLLPHRSALENVVFRFRYTATPLSEARRRAAELLERIGLAPSARTPARLLSGGEMQRVAIARALVLRPALLLADEPTGNLDPGAAARVIALLDEARRDGAAVLLATHNPGWLPRCDRVIRLPESAAPDRAPT
ncbi:MAG: ABC transporter ATP-binding protein [Kiritimatiellae bacterium]|nr:ABC transporter ATP-binding protein [Kiritimatiellia bacterium]